MCRKGNLPTHGYVNWHNYYGEQSGGSSKKLKIELSYDSAIPLLGTYLERINIQKDTFILMFTEALFTTVRRRKQPKCPSQEEWIEKMLYVYKMEYYSAIKE